MKKIVTYLVTLGMMLSMIPSSVSAADTANETAAVSESETSKYQEIKDPPASSISVASLAGTWTDVDTFEKLEITNVKAETKITSADLVAVKSDEGDGYMYMLNVGGNYAYWEADFNMTSANEKITFTYSSKDLTEENCYVTAGSTITALSGVVTPYDNNGNAGSPISVAWDKTKIIDKKDAKLVLSNYYENELYKGNFTFTDKDGKTISGNIKFEYAVEPDGNQSNWFTFYDKNGKLWNAFAATGEIPLNYIAAGHQGKPYFMHYLFGGSVNVETGDLNLRSEASTDSKIPKCPNSIYWPTKNDKRTRIAIIIP